MHGIMVDEDNGGGYDKGIDVNQAVRLFLL
jgi:hypothetical protein